MGPNECEATVLLDDQGHKYANQTNVITKGQRRLLQVTWNEYLQYKSQPAEVVNKGLSPNKSSLIPIFSNGNNDLQSHISTLSKPDINGKHSKKVAPDSPKKSNKKNSKKNDSSKQKKKIATNFNANINNFEADEKSNTNLNASIPNVSELPDLSHSDAKTMFHKTINSYVWRITKIEDINTSNTHHWQHKAMYQVCLSRVRSLRIKSNRSPQNVEKWLFHGTQKSLISKIVQNGFNRNYNVTAVYGFVK